MVQVMAVVASGPFFQRRHEHFHGQIDSCISNGMETKLPPCFVGVEDDGVQFLFRIVHFAPVRFTPFVGVNGVGSGARKAAISQDLDGAHPEAVVTLARHES